MLWFSVMTTPLMLLSLTDTLLSNSLPSPLCTQYLYNIGHMVVSGINYKLTHLHPVIIATGLLERRTHVSYKFYSIQIVLILSSDSTWRDQKVDKTFYFLAEKFLKWLLTLERTHISLILMDLSLFSVIRRTVSPVT